VPQITWKFSINGTAENWAKEKWGLRYNPFPQHGQYELNQADLALQSLAEENMTRAQIRKRLQPCFNQEFIELVIARYKPNELVHCEVTCRW